MSRNNTQELILTRGLEIIRKKGFNNTGIQEILLSANVPKGSFYFYFKSKHIFGLQLIDYYAEALFSMFDRCLEEKGLSPMEQLQKFFNEFSSFYEKNEFSGGCALGNIAQEMSDIDEDFRLKLQDIFDQMKLKIAEILLEAQSNGQIRLPIEAVELSDFIINSWHGSLMRTKVSKSPHDLHLFDRIVFNLLMAK